MGKGKMNSILSFLFIISLLIIFQNCSEDESDNQGGGHSENLLSNDKSKSQVTSITGSVPSNDTKKSQIRPLDFLPDFVCKSSNSLLIKSITFGFINDELPTIVIQTINKKYYRRPWDLTTKTQKVNLRLHRGQEVKPLKLITLNLTGDLENRGFLDARFKDHPNDTGHELFQCAPSQI